MTYQEAINAVVALRDCYKVEDREWTALTMLIASTKTLMSLPGFSDVKYGKVR